MGRLGLPLMMAIFLLTEMISGDYRLTIFYLLFGLLWYWLYGYFQAWFYRWHFARHVKETFAENFGIPMRMEITDVEIQTYDAGSEVKVLLSEIKSIDEIPSIILVILKGGGSLILPKERIAELDTLRTRLQEIANSLGITYERKDDWKWK